VVVAVPAAQVVAVVVGVSFGLMHSLSRTQSLRQSVAAQVALVVMVAGVGLVLQGVVVAAVRESAVVRQEQVQPLVLPEGMLRPFPAAQAVPG
jgi:hypothetical protein